MALSSVEEFAELAVGHGLHRGLSATLGEGRRDEGGNVEVFVSVRKFHRVVDGYLGNGHRCKVERLLTETDGRLDGKLAPVIGGIEVSRQAISVDALAGIEPRVGIADVAADAGPLRQTIGKTDNLGEMVCIAIVAIRADDTVAATGVVGGDVVVAEIVLRYGRERPLLLELLHII